ncbi:hypothetical protein A9D12_10185 [Erythrobacter neustonensis]|uniref:Uncharacterized protein n=1 Tax=Erythrobacter neustonensis TaxID=1112 RepID=A0A192D656_9SPHN|nr:hypothetical protein A9D12_10185 [Erythrobacter neustonensis]
MRFAERQPTSVDQAFAGRCKAVCHARKPVLTAVRVLRLRQDQFWVAQNDIAGLCCADPRPPICRFAMRLHITAEVELCQPHDMLFVCRGRLMHDDQARPKGCHRLRASSDMPQRPCLSDPDTSPDWRAVPAGVMDGANKCRGIVLEIHHRQLAVVGDSWGEWRPAPRPLAVMKCALQPFGLPYSRRCRPV